MTTTNPYANPYLVNIGKSGTPTGLVPTASNAFSDLIKSQSTNNLTYSALTQSAMDNYINTVLKGYNSLYSIPPSNGHPGVGYPPNPITGLYDLPSQIAQLQAGVPYTQLNTAQVAGLVPMPAGQVGNYQNSGPYVFITNPQQGSYQSIQAALSQIGSGSPATTTGGNNNAPILNSLTPSRNSVFVTAADVNQYTMGQNFNAISMAFNSGQQVVLRDSAQNILNFLPAIKATLGRISDFQVNNFSNYTTTISQSIFVQYGSIIQKLNSNPNVHIDVSSNLQPNNYSNNTTTTNNSLISRGSNNVDKTPPLLVTFTPADNMDGLAVNSNFLLNFDKTVQSGSGYITIRSTDGSDIKKIDAADNSQVKFLGQQVLINPTLDLLRAKDYYVTIDNGAIKDLTGNIYAGITNPTQYNFTTEGVDRTSPSLVSFTPENGRDGVSGDANILLNFDEAVKAGSGYITIHSLDGSVTKNIETNDTSQVTFSGRQVVINPTSDLLGGKGYYVTIDTGAIKDLAGNSYKGIFTTKDINFTTAGESIAPNLNYFSLRYNSNSVSDGAHLSLDFDESVKAGIGKIIIHNKDGSTAQSIAANNTSQVFFSGRHVDVNPTSDLLGGKDYYVTIDAGAIKDLAGNAYAGISTTTQFNFTTLGDSTAPKLINSYTPMNGFNDAYINTNIYLNFDESIRAGYGNIVIHNIDGSIAKSISVTDTSKVTISDRQVLVGPNADLTRGKSYYVTIDTGSFKDLSGNIFPGVTTNNQFRFTLAQDTIAPTLSSASPADNATGVAVGANIYLNFNEAIKAGSGNIDIHNADGSIAKRLSVNDSQVYFNGSQVTVNPATDLLAGKDYFVTVDRGAITDLVGNAYNGITNPLELSFTTESMIGANINGTPNKDQLLGTNKNDTFNGGKGSDSLWGMGGADTFKFSPGDTYANNHQSEALIFDFGTGARGVGDVIDYSDTLSIGGSSNAATADQALINQTTGLAQFALGSGTTLADAMHDITSRFTAAGDSKGEFALFQTPNFSGTYMFISDGQAGVTSGDTLVGLCGVSKVTGVDLSGGNLSIFGTSSNT